MAQLTHSTMSSRSRTFDSTSSFNNNNQQQQQQSHNDQPITTVFIPTASTSTSSTLYGSVCLPNSHIVDSCDRTKLLSYSTSTTLQSSNNNNDRNNVYESLDYEVCENVPYQDENSQRCKAHFKTEIIRWFVIFLIAFFTAITACGIVITIDHLSTWKHDFIKKTMDTCFPGECMYLPLLYWAGINSILVFCGSLLVTYVSPVSAGSGIPLIKCYLNGVKVPKVVRISTFLCKAFGVITSVSGGLACGKEGPMIHCGSVIAAGISQGKSTTFKKDFKIFKSFREDREKRDFVSAGAASGVAAAFGAPVGALLFSLEEGASFWNQSLTWKIFFCSMMTTFTLNSIMSLYFHSEILSYTGLLNFGKFEETFFDYSFLELPVYLFIGAAGGIFGTLYNVLNYQITKFRMKYITSNWIKVIEATFAATFIAALGFLLILSSQDCRINGSTTTFVKLHCPPGHHSVMAELWFNTPEAIVKALFHNEANTWSALTLAIFVVIYFIISCFTYGLSVSGGIFIPSLLIGAAGGRLMSVIARQMLMMMGFSVNWIFPGKFALVGAASMLGGVVRMTISLTVILIEATGNIKFGLPIMLSITVAKWVGDYFGYGLYDIHIRLNKVPMLPWEPPKKDPEIFAQQVMSSNVKCLRTKEKVGVIYDILSREENHNGFPVVDVVKSNTSNDTWINTGRLRGTILRWQLIVILENLDKKESLTLEDFRSIYPRYPKIPIERDELRDEVVNLVKYMNPSPYTVFITSSLARIFYLFRALGLRHLVVVDEDNWVQGMVTRKDLAKFEK